MNRNEGIRKQSIGVTSAAPSTTGSNGSSSRNRIRALKFNPPPLDLGTFIHFEEINYPCSHPPPLIPSVGNDFTLSAVNMATEGLLEAFSRCHITFHYDRRLNPRRVLTKPSRPTYNNGFDNEKHDYILYVNDVLGNEEGKKYVILDLLGQGTFGQVVKCQNVKTRNMVAVKVIKNQPAFFNQSMMEVTVLEMLNQKYDKEDKRHIVRMKDTFVFRQHLCIVVELLSLNLYDLIKQNQYRGFSLVLCRMFLTQILDAMKVLKEARIIHCDLKPENILLRNLESPAIKVIDFGSACHEHQTLYTYIQSRFYRSPEVLLGLPYSSSIDMWSLGCIAAELFLGLPIFPGASNYDQDSNRIEAPPKQYFSSTKLDEIIINYPIRPRDMSAKDREVEMATRKCFLDFVRGLLNLNPIERWSPYQAAQHPFVTGKPFPGPFVPSLPQVPIPPVFPISESTATNVSMAGASPMTATGTVKVKVQSKQRPRANTLSSLSLQDVPQQIQRISAATRDRNAPGVGPTERMAPDVVPDDSSYTEPPALLFDYSTSVGRSSNAGISAGSPATRHSSGAISGVGSTAPASQFAQPYAATSQAAGQPGVGHGITGAPSVQSERISAYMSNRRVSQPVIAAATSSRFPPRPSQVTLPVMYAAGAMGAVNSIPSSVPNAVWYGPEMTTFEMSPTPPFLQNQSSQNNHGNTCNAPRRGSLKADNPFTGQLGESMPNARSPYSSPSSGSAPTSRRSSAPHLQVDPSSNLPSTSAAATATALTTASGRRGSQNNTLLPPQPSLHGRRPSLGSVNANSPLSQSIGSNDAITFDMSIDSPPKMEVLDEEEEGDHHDNSNGMDTGERQDLRKGGTGRDRKR